MEEESKKITYESLWKAIIRPPRDYYTEEDMGPTNFILHGKSYIRKDFDLIDFHGLILKLSIVEPDPINRPFDIMPIVIYVHANSSSRAEGIHIKNNLLKKNINICSFDFEGSGYSEGEYISLGFHEKWQLKNVVDFIENYPGVGEIGLWGRSMGAATTLIYASMDKRIKAIVVDSPFTDFRRVAKETCMAQVSIPGFLIEGAISIIGKSVYNKNKMKINEIKPIEAVKKCDIPVMFVHAKDDDMVNFQHTLDLYNNYRGINKEIKEVYGGHNAKRSAIVMENIAKFFLRHLKDQNKINGMVNEPKEESFDNYMVNTNIIDTLPKKKNKNIYEEWGIPNPMSNPKDLELKKEDSNIINVDNNEIREELKEEPKNEIREEKIEEIKKEEKIEEIKKEEKIEDIKKEKKLEDIKKAEKLEDIKKEEKIEDIKKEGIKKEKNEKDKNTINFEQNNKEELNYGKNLTFYNTNKNFGSYIEACFNKDETKNNEKKIEDNFTKDNQNTTNNESVENNTINVYSSQPKRKTIYDDLNLRPKLK